MLLIENKSSATIFQFELQSSLRLKYLLVENQRFKVVALTGRIATALAI